MDDQKLDAPAEPGARLGFLLYRAGLAVSRGYERALAPLDTSPVEVGVLSALSYSGPQHVRGLARLLGIGRQSAVNVTKALLARQEIERRSSEEDTRLVVYVVTALGRSRLDRCEGVVAQFDARLRSTVGELEERELVRQLGRIVNAPFLAHEE